MSTIIERLLIWLNNNEFKINDKLVFKNTVTTGRGVHSIEEIKEDEILFHVPKKSMISYYNSKISTMVHLEDYFDDEDSIERKLFDNNWLLLLITILFEINLEKDSKWFPYLEYLPIYKKGYYNSDKLSKKLHNMPMYWQHKQLLELKGTSLEEKINFTRYQSLENDYLLIIQPFVEKYKQLCFSDINISYDLYIQIGCVISSYSFTFEDDFDEDVHFVAMCPMADALNHKTYCNNARLFQEQIDKHDENDNNNNNNNSTTICEDDGYKNVYVMKSIKTIAKDTEVFNTYGDLSNAELLFKYGYVDFNDNLENDMLLFQNDFDSIIFFYSDMEGLLKDFFHECHGNDISDSKDDDLWYEYTDLLNTLGLLKDRYVIRKADLETSKFPDCNIDLFEFLCVLSMSKQEFNVFHDLVFSLLYGNEDQQFDSDEDDGECSQVFIDDEDEETNQEDGCCSNEKKSCCIPSNKEETNDCCSNEKKSCCIPSNKDDNSNNDDELIIFVDDDDDDEEEDENKINVIEYTSNKYLLMSFFDKIILSKQNQYPSSLKFDLHLWNNFTLLREPINNNNNKDNVSNNSNNSSNSREDDIRFKLSLFIRLNEKQLLNEFHSLVINYFSN